MNLLLTAGEHVVRRESESEKLKSALHALAGMLPRPRTTEKTKNVLEQSAASAPEREPEPAKGHGRNGASSYTGSQKVAVPHPQLHAGDPCPGCEKGKVYPQKEPRTLVRIVGQGFGLVLPAACPVPGSLRRSFDRVQQEINAWVDRAKMVA